jgi:hypothetical protein
LGSDQTGMKVLISSTYWDLADHRKAVIDSIRRLGLVPVAMEVFGARPQEPLEACLSEVASADLFVGIYARRYGHIPKHSQTSVTEAEFWHAAKLCKPIFCFVVDDRHPWPSEFVEAEPAQTHLRRLIGDIESMLVRDTFTTPDVLASRVATSVGRYLLAQSQQADGRSTVDRFVELTLVDVVTMLHVDLMRLFCVAGSDLARRVNASRYAEFVDVADLHIAELRLYTSRLGPSAPAALIGLCSDVERRLGWLLTRLRREPHLDRGWPEFMSVLRESSQSVATLASLAGGNQYEAKSLQALEAAAQTLTLPGTTLSAPDEFVRRRFAAQSHVVAGLQATEGLAIATVRDDIDRRLAVPYFALDLALIRQALQA